MTDTHKTRSKPVKCSARNQDGSACNAQVWRDGQCRWHHPALAAERRQNAVKGGKSRSNEARARKALLGNSQDLKTVKGALLLALAGVYNGSLDPARGAAMAQIAKAILAVAGAAELESRIAELESLAQERAS